MGKNKEPKSKQSEAEKAEKKLRKITEEIADLRKKYIRQISKIAAMDTKDYTLKSSYGNDVKLSEMFGDKKYLYLVHNMGKSCSYCTLWADGFSGITYFMEKKAAFGVVSPDAPEVQKEFAESRGWKFKMYSSVGSDFTKDMGYYTEAGAYWPGVSVFQKNADGSIRRISKDFFGPGDFYSSPWHFFDLLPQEDETEKK